MTQFVKRTAAFMLAFVLCICMVPVQPSQAADYVANWGTRGEVATELSDAAQSFYTGEYTYDVFYSLENTHKQNDVPQSEIYKALQSFMVSRHTTQTSYGETRYLYMYTDCEKGDTSTILSFYSGTPFSSTWDQGATWNREHVWPNSKALSYETEGRVNNNKRGEAADIMMLRPTLKVENEAENDAFGESSGCQDPGPEVRGDVARDILYVYVRWGNAKYMWGKSGVMESLEILLRWMQEDPVDTWELGRNDSVQSITGTRNVFVDYPELAFVLFGQEIPEDMVTPSGEAQNQDQTPEPKPTEPEASTPAPTEPTPTTTAPAATTTKPADKVETPNEEENPPVWLIVVAVVLLVLLAPMLTRKKGKKRRRR